MQRDQGFVRQVHSTQNFGRRVFNEQRDFRRANPGFSTEPAAGNSPDSSGRTDCPDRIGPDNNSSPVVQSSGTAAAERLDGQQPGSAVAVPYRTANRAASQPSDRVSRSNQARPIEPGLPPRPAIVTHIHRLAGRPGLPHQTGLPPRAGQPQRPVLPAQPGARRRWAGTAAVGVPAERLTGLQHAPGVQARPVCSDRDCPPRRGGRARAATRQAAAEGAAVVGRGTSGRASVRPVAQLPYEAAACRVRTLHRLPAAALSPAQMAAGRRCA